jgi:hypothetical protein
MGARRREGVKARGASSLFAFVPSCLRAFVLLLLFVSAMSISAQRASVQISVQPAEILIGEQAFVTLRVIAPEGAQIYFPIYEHELIPGIEVLGMLPLDTLVENNVMTINFGYIITSFDAALYYVPFMPIMFEGDTIFSNSFGINVVAPELTERTLAEIERLHTQQVDGINFEELGTYDIKPIRRAPFVWTDWLWIVWIFLGILFLAALFGVLFYLYLRKKNKGYFFAPPVVIPPHVLAIQEIDKLKAEKIWQQGREKEFYTKLTDILRIYIAERYGVNALEMTSGEIMNEIEKRAEVDSVCENLKQILSTSDLVKFAKHKPYNDENDLSLVNAYFFVSQTRKPDLIKQTEETKS